MILLKNVRLSLMIETIGAIDIIRSGFKPYRLRRHQNSNYIRSYSKNIVDSSTLEFKYEIVIEHFSTHNDLRAENHGSLFYVYVQYDNEVEKFPFTDKNTMMDIFNKCESAWVAFKKKKSSGLVGGDKNVFML